MRIVIDAYGSESAPLAEIEGGILAAREFGDEIILIGDKPRIDQILAGKETNGLTLTVIHAAEEILMTDKPSEVARQKKGSSMHIGLGMVKDGSAEAFISAGNTGATLTIAMLSTIRRIRGIKRPGLGLIFPTPGMPFLIDNGANADSKPEYLLQFAQMGSIYMQRVRNIQNPTVAIISNGEEEGKGNELVNEAGKLLAASDLNFVGNIEPSQFFAGAVDVGVTDGFTGNIMLKTAESISRMLLKSLKDELLAGTRTKVGAALAKPAFDRVRTHLDPDRVGGAPLLGVNGVVIVSHGKSTPTAIHHAVKQARLMVEFEVVDAISQRVKRT